ncbi:MAG TPA: hypothetical protein VM261_37900 [Kofleriaceae bacterium]|nr:hypothetical protein [Kofleriaceae bacterium]
MKLVLAALVLVFTGCGSSCNQQIPQSDICELAPGAPRPTVDAVRIVRRVGEGYEPIVEDSTVDTVVGGQGSDMFVVSLQLVGTGIPECIAQETFLEDVGGELISSEQAPLIADTNGTGATTGDILLPYYGPYGGHVRIRAEVQGATASVSFWANEMGTIDASSIDAGPDA